MTPMLVVYFFVVLALKHFVCDFPLQNAYQYKNKGIYGHPGGILHAGIHAIGTLLALSACVLPLSMLLWLVLADGVIHYHIDWAKVKLNTYYKLTPTTNEYFWHLLGLDQLLHYMTYAGMVWWLVYVTQ